MIKTMEIGNFRCFERVQLSGLTRVNVVTGANASGKSALLEALYIAGNGTARAVELISAARMQAPPVAVAPPGLGILLAPHGQPATIGTYFDPLFRSARAESHDGGDTGPATPAPILFSYTDSEGAEYTLKIAYQRAGARAPRELMLVARGLGGQAAVPIVFDRQKKVKNRVVEQTQVAIAVAPTGELIQTPSRPLGPATLIFGANINYAEYDNVTWFSQLKERNEADKAVSWVQKEFPFVEGIEVLAPTGASGLYAIMHDGTRRRMANVSLGIYKIVSILLAATHTRNGILVIDEIENGIFYEKYPAVWRALYDFAKETENQIFVSSHSSECLAALPDVIGDATDDFCLLRAERENGTCTVRRISGIAMAAALRGENEVRGFTNGTESDTGQVPPALRGYA